MRANIQGLTRLVTLALKYRVPVEEIIGELDGIACPSEFVAEDGAKSCPDGIAKALKAFLNGNKSERRWWQSIAINGYHWFEFLTI